MVSFFIFFTFYYSFYFFSSFLFLKINQKAAFAVYSLSTNLLLQGGAAVRIHLENMANIAMVAFTR